MHQSYTKRSDPLEWKRLVIERLNNMSTFHNVRRRKICAGIDIRISAPFVRKDLLHAHELLDMRDDDGALLGFAFVKTNLAPLYVSLVASFSPGIGHALLYELQNTSRFHHSKIVLRSTDNALGFYLKLNFHLFDWTGVESGYVGGGDEALTNLLRQGDRTLIRREMLRRAWLNEDEVEWPLVLARVTPSPEHRSSARLRARLESSRLKVRTATDRTSSKEERSQCAHPSASQVPSQDR